MRTLTALTAVALSAALAAPAMAIDALCNRPEVDATRIGCIGNSYGGRTTMWLTICDERIQACVPAGCMNTFRERSLKLSS